MRKRLEQLLEKYARYGRESDIPRISRAFEVACKAHEGQLRNNGEPYITHPLSVADILADMELDADSLIAAILHDTVEDTNLTLAEVSKQFGKQVAEIVDGVTKLDSIQYSSKEEEEMENLRKMFIAMAQDIRVILIKLADRLHNMRTIDAKEERKRREKSLETMDIYAPIAHRLGITKIKWELEDLSLRYLDPIGYKEISEALEGRSDKTGAFIENIRIQLEDTLRRHGIEARIEGRVKHIYSIYRKMYAQDKTIDEIYDIYAIRVIVDTHNDCYNVLGLVHDVFRPIPGRFKDYISTPKPNMYQSLHTTVIGREGVPFEIQIRTWEMHQIAEYGIAAHWKYKQGMTGSQTALDEKLTWVRRMLETQEDTDAEDFIKNFKIDMFGDEVYIFTPKGDVISLPAGGTPVDFAYAIHSAVGNRMIGAKVNSRMTTIDTPLQNGDIVEIITSNASHGPSRDWLKIAKTNEARNKIRQWFKRERREENVAEGREELERAFKRNGIPIADALSEDIISVCLKRLSFNTYDDLCAGIGYGGITTMRVINRVREEMLRANKLKREQEIEEKIAQSQTRRPERSENGIIVKGIDNCLVKFARCCTPIPGDPVVGFVTRGHGVSVHRSDCANVSGIQKGGGEESERLIEVSWDPGSDNSFEASIRIVANEKRGLIVDITSLLANMRINLHSLNAKQIENSKVLVALSLDITDTQQLETVTSRLRNVSGVSEVSRVSG